MIDKDEYPVTAAIEQRCVSMVADLFHAENLRDDDPSAAVGCPPSGPARAVMLAGLGDEVALARPGRGLAKRTANLVMGPTSRWCGRSSAGTSMSNRAICRWRGPLRDHPEQVVDAVDEDTIGVVAIVGTTFTGELRARREICAALDKLAGKRGAARR